jgi:hypothetical protein
MTRLLTTTAWLAGITILVAAILAFAGLCSCAPMCIAAVVCAVTVGAKGLVAYVRREVADWTPFGDDGHIRPDLFATVRDSDGVVYQRMTRNDGFYQLGAYRDGDA